MKFPKVSTTLLFIFIGLAVVVLLTTCIGSTNILPYNNDPRDLCNMSIEDFDKRIDLLMGNLKRLIKTSNHKERKFYPIIFVVGTYRNSSKFKGIVDMDCRFQNIANSHGLTLHDKQMIETNNPHLVCSLQRNYELKMVHKNYETSLVFLKY